MVGCIAYITNAFGCCTFAKPPSRDFLLDRFAALIGGIFVAKPTFRQL